MTVKQAGSRSNSGAAATAAVLAGAAILAGYLAMALLASPGTPLCAGGLSALTHWDGAWYHGIALHGYAPIAGPQQPTNFFPLFPAVAALSHLLLPFLPLEVTGVAVNCAAALGALLLCERLLRDVAGTPRVLAVVFLVTVPGALFLVVFYSEALFLFLVVLCLWACDRRRLVVAAAAVALATLDRPPGLLLLVPVAIVLWQDARVATLRGAAVIGLALMGVVATLAYFGIARGDPLAYMHARHAFGPNGTAWLVARHSPAFTATFFIDVFAFQPNALQALTNAITPFPTGVGYYLDLVAIGALLLCLRYRKDWAIYSAAALATNILVGGLNSQLRYAAVVAPLWLATGVVLGQRSRGRVVLVVLMVAGLLVNLVLVRSFANCAWAG